MPNDGFMAQLLLYQEHLTHETFITPVMRWYNLQKISRMHYKSGGIALLFLKLQSKLNLSVLTSEDLSIVFIQNSQAKYPVRCKHCRYNIRHQSLCMVFKEIIVILQIYAIWPWWYFTTSWGEGGRLERSFLDPICVGKTVRSWRL